jgi:modulator of FtsH protease HflC
MMINRLPYIGLALVALAGLVYSAVFVVSPKEQAIVLRFGEITRTISEPGLYFKVPTAIVDTVQFVEKRVQRFELDDIRVQVRDGRRYIVNDNLRTRLDASLRSVYGQRSFEDALSDQRLQMMQEVKRQITPQALQLGVEIADVRILRTDLLDEVSEQTFERMKAERLAEAAQLRALGNQQATRIKAEADREAVVIVAEAQRDAEVLRGQGDAERNGIFATAYSRDPEFFKFYRSLQAYQTGIAGDGTTLVLSPESEFFRFMQSSSGTAKPAAPQ